MIYLEEKKSYILGDKFYFCRSSYVKDWWLSNLFYENYVYGCKEIVTLVLQPAWWWRHEPRSVIVSSSIL